MTPSEMEDQIKNLNEFVAEIAQILPTLATKQDLTVYATKQDLTVYATKQELTDAIAKLATREDLEASKRYTESLILVTRHEIHRVDDKVTAMAADIKTIAEQVAILTARRRRDRRS